MRKLKRLTNHFEQVLYRCFVHKLMNNISNLRDNRYPIDMSVEWDDFHHTIQRYRRQVLDRCRLFEQVLNDRTAQRNRQHSLDNRLNRFFHQFHRFQLVDHRPRIHNNRRKSNDRLSNLLKLNFEKMLFEHKNNRKSSSTVNKYCFDGRFPSVDDISISACFAFK